MAESLNYSANITGSFWKLILTQCVKRFMGYMGIYCYGRMGYMEIYCYGRMGYMGIYCYGRMRNMLHCATTYLKIRIMFSDLCLLFMQKFTLTSVRLVSYFGPILAKIYIVR